MSTKGLEYKRFLKAKRFPDPLVLKATTWFAMLVNSEDFLFWTGSGGHYEWKKIRAGAALGRLGSYLGSFNVKTAFQAALHSSKCGSR